MRKKNQTEKSNCFSTIKVPFVSNEIECPVCKNILIRDECLNAALEIIGDMKVLLKDI